MEDRREGGTPLCEVHQIQRDAVQEAVRKMPKEDHCQNLAALFKMLGDENRVRILWALSCRELCVCDIAAVTGMSQSAISHQLRLLKQVRLVRHRRDGRVVYYRLDDEHVRTLFAQGLDHVKEL